MAKLSQAEKAQLDKEREGILAKVERALRPPMMVLGFVWLVLLILQLTQSGPQPMLRLGSEIIWGIFILDFLLRFFLAPKKKQFLKHNWLTTIALIVPALRVFQFIGVLRIFIAGGGASIVQIVTSINRGMNELASTMGRRGFGYVSLLTIIITFAGAAGIYAFEHKAGNGIPNYGEALYWTIMMITTIGSEYWPHTTGGKILTVLLSLYAVAILGYIAASLATFFIDKDASDPKSDVASQHSIEEVKTELRALREELRLARESRPQ